MALQDSPQEQLAQGKTLDLDATTEVDCLECAEPFTMTQPYWYWACGGVGDAVYFIKMHRPCFVVWHSRVAPDFNQATR